MSFPLILVLAAALAVLAATYVLFTLSRRLRSNDSLSGDNSLSASIDSHLRDMTEHIEETVKQQQDQGETQRQRLAQQIDSVQQGVGEQRVLLDNLRSEVRHESKRRDHELEEIRGQIATIQNALPTLGAASDSETLALPASNEASALADPPVSEAPGHVGSASSADSAPGWQEVAWDEDAGSIASNAPAGDDPATAVEAKDIFTFEDTFAGASFKDATADAEGGITPESTVEEAPSAMFAETTDVPASFDIEPDAASAEAVAEAPAAVPSFDTLNAAEASTAEPPPVLEMPVDELASPDLPSAPDAAPPNDWGIQPDASSEAEAPAEAVFEELTLAEMSFEEFSFEDFAVEDVDAEDAGAPGDVATGAFDADPFAVDQTAALSGVTGEAPEIHSEPQQTFPDVAAFTVAPPASPQAEDAPVQDDAPEPSFAPTPFLDDTLPVADPLAFEEAFVPTPILDASPAADKADDLFAAWSPTDAPDAAPEPLTFVETAAPPAGEPPASAAEPEADRADVDAAALSTFEDWNLDPVPTPASDATWVTPETPSNAFEAWAPSQPAAPAAPAEPPVAPAPPDTTAWVARNESLQPTPPPAPQPEAPAVAPATYAEAAPVAGFDQQTFAVEPRPLHAEAPTPEETPSASATFAVEPSGTAAPEPSPAVAAAPAAVPPPAPAPSPASAAAGAAAQPAAAPADAERLTILPSIDEDTERALRLAGVTSLDEMARWSRTDARRIAAQVGVSEDTVLNHWVFEAQTALFERFAQQAGV